MNQPGLDDADEDLARWLQESGRRKVNPKLAELYKQGKITLSGADPGGKKTQHIMQPRLLLLFAFLVASYLQYFYFDIHLKIDAMYPIAIFVFR